MKQITDLKDCAPEVREWLAERGISQVISTVPNPVRAPKKKVKA